MNGFYNANTEEKFNRVTKKLLNNGYIWVGIDKNPSFEKCKRQIHENAKLIINAFYNDITRKHEIQFGTRSIYKTYPQFKNIKIMEMED